MYLVVNAVLLTTLCIVCNQVMVMVWSVESPSWGLLLLDKCTKEQMDIMLGQSVLDEELRNGYYSLGL